MQEHRGKERNESYSDAHMVRSAKCSGDKVGYDAEVVDQRVERSLALLAKPKFEQKYEGVYCNDEVSDVGLAEARLVVAKRDHEISYVAIC